MSKNPYDQFFSKAQDVKRGDVDQVRFTLKSKTASSTTAKSQALNEEKLRAALRTPSRKKRKAPFPWKAASGLVFSLVLAVGYLASPSTFEKILSKVEVHAIGGAEAAETPKKGATDPAEKSQAGGAKEEKASSTNASADKAKGPDEKGAVHEEVSQFEKLKQRKDELDAREKELNELEEELQKQKVELDKRITQLEDMRNQIAKTLKDRVDIDQEKVTKLVDLYSNMKPKQAADVIGTINEELAVEVLSKMKKKNAAEIMNLLTPEKSRVLSEKYTGYRRISSTDTGKGN